MRLDKEERKILKAICEKYNVTEKQALEAIKAPMRFIREKTKEINLGDDVTKEEFEELTYNFNIPFIGKLYANYNNHKRYIDVKRKRNKEELENARSTEEQGGGSIEGDVGDSR